jgi:hypothetical protein
MTQRLYRHPFLGLFDGAGTNASTDRRAVSTTPLQALYLMNNPFVHAQARKFAERLLAERSDDESRIEWAYLLLLSRPVSPEERTMACEHLATVRARLETLGTPTDQREARSWESLVRALFACNELVYVN